MANRSSEKMQSIIQDIEMLEKDINYSQTVITQTASTIAASESTKEPLTRELTHLKEQHAAAQRRLVELKAAGQSHVLSASLSLSDSVTSLANNVRSSNIGSLSVQQSDGPCASSGDRRNSSSSSSASRRPSQSSIPAGSDRVTYAINATNGSNVNLTKSERVIVNLKMEVNKLTSELKHLNQTTQDEIIALKNTYEVICVDVSYMNTLNH